jgi:hypothetical protein
MLIEVDEYNDEESYTREGVKLILEEQDDSLVITYADLNPEDTYHLVILLVDRLSQMVGQEYNQVLEDLKEIEEEGEK